MINIEGDAGHPISEGTLCSKGAAAIQVVNNPRRLQKVLYRAPSGKAWEEKTWAWALERMIEHYLDWALAGARWADRKRDSGGKNVHAPT